MLSTRIRNKAKISLFFILSLVIYLLISWYLIKNIFYLEIDPDGISYISIAYKYLHRDPNAVNVYWSPLYSWLLVPFLKFGVDALWAGRYLNTILGLLSIFGSWLLATRFNISKIYCNLVLLFLIPLNLYFSLFYSTPDLLLLVITQFYLFLVFDRNYYRNILRLVLIGFLGGLGYLAKGYFFYFFILHFGILNFYYFRRNRNSFHRINLLKNLLFLLIPFLIISGSWAGVISNKYQRLTLGTAGEYNYKIAGPNIPEFPVFYLGFLPPVNETAISSWEDPTNQNIENWNPLSSKIYFYHQIKIIIGNVYKTASIIQSFSWYAVGLLTIITLIFLGKEKNNTKDDDILFSIMTILAWIVGYIFISIEGRYLWIIEIILILLGVKMLNNFTLTWKNKFIKLLFILFFLLSFLKMPIKELTNPITVRKDIYDIAQNLKTKGVSGKIASNSNWDTSLFITYYLNGKYYGSDKSASSADINYKLKNLEVDYYLVWGERINFEMENYQLMKEVEFSNLRVYQLRNN